jgi:hypothetical protein
VIGPAPGVGLDHELRHLMLVAGKVRPLVELEHQLPDLVAPLAHLELADEVSSVASASSVNSAT